MISGTVLFVGTIALLYLIYSKLKFLIKQSGKSILRICTEFGLALVIFLMLLFSQFSLVHASSEQPFYMGDVFEAAQYVSFATYLVPIIFFLTFMEIIVSIKALATRGRLLPDSEE